MSSKFKPPRGFRDFTPEVALLRREVINKVIKVFEKYGFDPIDTPAVEYWETLAGKYGEEAESRLIWRFVDPWSRREYALRYDLTVPLARFIASHPEVPLPFKRYHVGPVWRHEEPQKSRYREFYQCDADIVGSPYPEADAEILELTIDALRELGFRDFKVRVNDRRILFGIFEEELGLKNPLPVYRAIDKLDKIGLEGVKRELINLGLSEGSVDKIAEIISVSGEPAEILRSIRFRFASNPRIAEACGHLEEAFAMVGDLSAVRFDLSLARGLDYYTGPIYEVVMEEPKIGSVAGGGRYDNLIGMFVGKDVPATGISLGIERLIDAGLELGVFNLNKLTVTEVQVVVLDWGVLSYAWRVVRELRRRGISTRIDLRRSSEELQRRKARRLGVPVLAFVGRAEAEGGMVTIYDTATSERATVRLEEAPDLVLKRLKKA